MQRCDTSSRGCAGAPWRARYDRHHVLLDHLAQAHAGIETGGDDVGFGIGHGDIEGDARMSFDEACHQRPGQEALRDRRDREA